MTYHIDYVYKRHFGSDVCDEYEWNELDGNVTGKNQCCNCF